MRLEATVVELAGAELPGNAECAAVQPQVEVVRETLAVPFTVPQKSPDGKPIRSLAPTVHFGMLDTGA